MAYVSSLSCLARCFQVCIGGESREGGEGRSEITSLFPPSPSTSCLFSNKGRTRQLIPLKRKAVESVRLSTPLPYQFAPKVNLDPGVQSDHKPQHLDRSDHHAAMVVGEG